MSDLQSRKRRDAFHRCCSWLQATPTKVKSATGVRSQKWKSKFNPVNQQFLLCEKYYSTHKTLANQPLQSNRLQIQNPC